MNTTSPEIINSQNLERVPVAFLEENDVLALHFIAEIARELKAVPRGVSVKSENYFIQRELPEEVSEEETKNN